MTSHPLKDEDGNTASHYLAYGAMWFLFLIGLGGCVHIAFRESSAPLIQITHTK